jgi:hypothetical protein
MRVFKSRDPGPVSALHAELLEQLTAKTVVADAALAGLAQARGQAMREGLIGYGLDGGRVAIAQAVSRAARDKGVASTLTLGAGAPPSATAPVAAPVAAP